MRRHYRPTQRAHQGRLTRRAEAGVRDREREPLLVWLVDYRSVVFSRASSPPVIAKAWAAGSATRRAGPTGPRVPLASVRPPASPPPGSAGSPPRPRAPSARRTSSVFRLFLYSARPAARPRRRSPIQAPRVPPTPANARPHVRDEVAHGRVHPELEVPAEHRAVERALERPRAVAAAAHAEDALVAKVVPARKRHGRRPLALAAEVAEAHDAAQVVAELLQDARHPGRRRRAGGRRGGGVRVRRRRAVWSGERESRGGARDAAALGGGAAKEAAPRDDDDDRGDDDAPVGVIVADERARFGVRAGEAERLVAALVLVSASFLRRTSAEMAALMAWFLETAIGVFPSLFREVSFAPASKSTATHLAWPPSAAQCSAVFPAPLGLETSRSPARSNARTTSACPAEAPRRSATPMNVRRVAGVTSSGARDATSARRWSRSPEAAAATSAARYVPALPAMTPADADARPRTTVSGAPKTRRERTSGSEPDARARTNAAAHARDAREGARTRGEAGAYPEPRARGGVPAPKPGSRENVPLTSRR